MRKLALLLALAAAPALAQDAPLPEVEPWVDLEKYAGTWYEIAAYPQPYQEGCVGSTATYTLRDDGGLDVLNRCYQDGFDGPVRTAAGVARVPDPEGSTAKLEVRIGGPEWSDYWILEVGPTYEYAVVGQPDREGLWILSRDPTIDPVAYAELLDRLEAQGWDTSKLEKTEQR